jgi:deoxyribodipyrimidine photo-lyase
MGGKRARILQTGTGEVKGPILYWMQRAQRIEDNWSLLYAQEFATKHDQPLIIVFNLFPRFLDATLRQFDFMLKGLAETSEKAAKKKFPFYIFQGYPEETIATFIEQNNIGALFTDFNPLKLISESKQKLVKKINIPVYEVDSQNIIPAWIASPKKEFGAYTLRPKIKKLLPEFLEDIPTVKSQKTSTPKLKFKNIAVLDPQTAIDHVKTDTTVMPVKWLLPGAKAAHKQLANFIENHLPTYTNDRNDPNLNGTSHMSPYLHYGQISAQRIAYEVSSLSGVPQESKDAYLEELIVRRELADNFCYYCPDYDNFKGFHEWAQKTLNEHRFDRREYLYTQEQFEHSETHDPLWNAAQNQLKKEGKMHGFMRMYWAKKILEWTASPDEAQAIAIYLNDKYELDGIDPNGYTGIAWSIGGVHDRAWTERPVFGKIRFMNYNGCKRKFDVNSYQAKYLGTTLF